MGNTATAAPQHDTREVRPPGPCQALACDIQTCLAKNGYREERCQAEMDAFKSCMLQHKHDTSPEQERKSSTSSSP